MNKQDGRKFGVEAQEAVGFRVVDFLRHNKGTQWQAADFFQLSLRGVKKIWQQYKEGGRKALRAKKRGPVRSTSRLSKEEVRRMKKRLQKGTPDEYGLPYQLWTAGAVRLLLKKKPR